MSLLRYVAALFAGAATVLAFAPTGVYPIALVSLALLVRLWMRAPPQACFALGFTFGMGLFGAGVSWIYVSLSQFGGMPPVLAGAVTLLFCALLSVFPAAAGWLQARIPGPDLARALLLIPASWTLFEWLRGWVLTGFPWLSAGYAATGWVMQGFAPLLGVYGLSWLTLALAGLLWSFVAGRHRVIAVLAVVAVLAGAAALRGVAWTAPQGAAVSVALLQGNIEQDLKFRPERYARTLETYASLAEGSAARLIVLPETAIPRFLDRVEPAYLARLEAAAARSGGDLLLGVPIRVGDGQYYNGVLSLGRSAAQAYYKMHLVPFGEYMPSGLHWVLHLLDIPLADFSSGPAEQPPLAAGGQRIAVNVCYEDAFGADISRRAADATLLVNVSNVAWFGDSLAPEQHLQIASLRAIETGRMHLTATNTGITAAIDRDGTVLARLPPFTEGRLEILAQGYSGTTPYMRFGDWPTLGASLFILAAAVLLALHRR